jgi:uncharacterized membrane protein YjgN (DUF898 family)
LTSNQPIDDPESGGVPPGPLGPPIAPEQPNTGGYNEHAFTFTGRASDYFRIWIVNLFLIIFTFGIYSAWAKVRKKRFFYGHTWVADANFEYHADPVAILKGRLIAVVALVCYYVVGQFMPRLAVGIALCLFAAAPWFIARSMAFNAFNSSYRNVRFRFFAGYRDVLKIIWPFGIFIALPLLFPHWDPSSKSPPTGSFWWLTALQMITLAVAYPYAVGALSRLRVDRSQYGAIQMRFNGDIDGFYNIYATAVVVAIMGMLGVSIAGAILGAVTANAASAGNWITLLFAASYLFMFSLLTGYTRSRVGNLVFNSSNLANRVYFRSTLKARKLGQIYITNLLAILFSAGLATPWAAVRIARYRASCLSLSSTIPFDDFAADTAAEIGAAGEEVGEFFNIDISL